MKNLFRLTVTIYKILDCRIGKTGLHSKTGPQKSIDISEDLDSEILLNFSG
jgi:hypothetical protein